MSIFEFHDYREFLRESLAERARKNPRFSLRAMARGLGVAPSYLSTVLKGQKHLSPETASSVAMRLALDSEEADYFRLLVQKDATKSPALKETLLEKIRLTNPGLKVDDLDVDMFKAISGWQHFALMAATELSDQPSTSKAMAQALEIPLSDAESSLMRLERLEMIQKDESGTFKKTKGNPRVVSNVANEALRGFHRQTLQKAIESLDSQSPEEKVIGSETFCIDSAQVDEFRKLCDEFFDKALALAAKGRRKDRVYHLGVQFFNFTPALKKKPVKNHKSAKEKTK